MRIVPTSVRSRLQAGLLTRFAVAGLVAVVLLGVVLVRTLSAEIRGRSLADARQAAQIIDDTIVQPKLSSADLQHGLSKAQIASLDHELSAVLRGNEPTVARIKVWNRADQVVYANDHSIIGHKFTQPDDDREDALDGHTASEISSLDNAENANDRRFGKLFEVYTPLRFNADPKVPPAGAFELYLPYKPIAADIAADTRRLYLLLAGGLALLYLALFRIVAGASTKLRRQATENEYLALHDTLTGLPNRSLFHDRATRAILSAKRAGGSVGLLLLDLDRFKEVNDTLGHPNGDLLLQEIGGRLHATLRESDTVARLGGDEFGLLLPTVADEVDALRVAEKVRTELRRPFELQGVRLDLEGSIGIALYPQHGDDVDTLMQRADVAMYLAKEDHGGCQLYAADRDEYSPGKLALVAELRRGIDQGELFLHYQPQARLAEDRIVAVEALVRWQHPSRGLLPPGEFVPLAERTGLTHALTLFVLTEALGQLHRWLEAGLDLDLAVNLSARDLLDESLPGTIVELLAANDVPASRLELEITESVILADPLRARRILLALSEIGVRIAIDDYGSGYSSLSYLKHLPVDVIKIDRSFVLNMATDASDAVIVRSTVELGRSLGLTVVAEGVETATNWEQLKTLGCELAQGFYLSRPVPPDEIAALLGRPAAIGASPVTISKQSL
jgi:diguanylate cyclase (GGDEF)-like protein